MENFLPALREIMSGTLLAPRGAGYACLVVAMVYTLAVLRAQRVYRDADQRLSSYFIATLKSPDLSQAFSARVDLLQKEFVSKVATLLLWLGFAMTMFASQAYVEAAAFQSVVPAAPLDRTIFAWPDAAGLHRLDYLNALYFLGFPAVALMLMWAVLPAALNLADYTPRELAVRWLNELTGDKLATEAPATDDRSFTVTS